MFQLAPPATGQTQWTETVLTSFGGANDGNYPVGSLIFGKNGALYGTTEHGGGTLDAGTVFQLTPPATGQTQWTETVLHSFTGGNDGAAAAAGLIVGMNGALYGTTAAGGTLGNSGTVFKLAPPAAGQTAWSETVLHNFGATGDGFGPSAGLIFGGALELELFGTTESGGAFGGFFKGTVFRLKL